MWGGEETERVFVQLNGNLVDWDRRGNIDNLSQVFFSIKNWQNENDADTNFVSITVGSEIVTVPQVYVMVGWIISQEK